MKKEKLDLVYEVTRCKRNDAKEVAHYRGCYVYLVHKDPKRLFMSFKNPEDALEDLLKRGVYYEG